MKKSRFYVVLALLLTAMLVLAACSSGGAVEEPVEEAPAVEEPAAEEPMEEPTAEEPMDEEAPAEEPTAEEPMDEETPAEEPTAEEEAMGEEAMGDLMVLEAGGCDYGGKFERIEATDEHTVVFTMCAPDPAFEAKIAFEGFGIQPSEYIEATGGTGELLERPIGTGPYMLDSWNRGDSVVMTRFDDYWGEPAKDETMVVRWATEGATRLLELQAGQVDQISFVSPDDFATVEEDPNLVLLPNPNPNILYLGFSNNFEPYDQQLVRQAIAMGIDRQRIVDNFFPEGSEVASHFTPCSIPNGCQGEDWYEFNPEEARALLEEAGLPDGFDTTIYYRDVFRVYLPEPSLVAVEIQNQLQENLGINASVEVMESGQFIDESTSGNLELYLLGWGADYPHVTNFLDFHFSQDNPQFGAAYPEIYEPLQEASQIVDVEEAAPLYEQANNAIKELVPMVPIAHGSAADAALADAEGANVRPFGQTVGHLVDTPDDVFVYMQAAEPISLYCADESDGETFRVCSQMVDSLLGYAMDSGETVPALAESCDPSEDGLVWTCNLRQGVTFHDGSAFDANDVVASYAAGLDASSPLHTGNTGAWQYYSYLWGLMNESDSGE